MFLLPIRINSRPQFFQVAMMPFRFVSLVPGAFSMGSSVMRCANVYQAMSNMESTKAANCPSTEFSSNRRSRSCGKKSEGLRPLQISPELLHLCNSSSLVLCTM